MWKPGHRSNKDGLAFSPSCSTLLCMHVRVCGDAHVEAEIRCLPPSLPFIFVMRSFIEHEAHSSARPAVSQVPGQCPPLWPSGGVIDRTWPVTGASLLVLQAPQWPSRFPRPCCLLLSSSSDFLSSFLNFWGFPIPLWPATCKPHL